MANRRSFLKNFMGAAAGAWLFTGARFPDSPSEIPPIPAEGENEDFWKLVRKHFPLDENLAYLNNGTRGPQPFQVLEEVERAGRFFSEKGSYRTLHAIREEIARELGFHPSELALTRNTTEGLNIIASGLSLRKKDEVIITTREHVGNALPWLNQMRRQGIKLVPFTPAPTAAENLELIESLITKRTRVIAIPHMTSPTGHILPVREVCQLARSKNILSCIDGAQSAGQLELDFEALGCDFFASSFHKWYLGPAGSGFLFVKRGSLEKVDAVHVGAYSDTGWEISESKTELKSLVDSARKFEYGTRSHALAAGSLEALKFMHGIGLKKIEKRCRELGDLVLEELKKEGNRIEILSPLEAASRAGMIGFRIKGKDNRAFFEEGTKRKIRIRFVPESGLDSLRVSTHIYNSPEDIRRFGDYLREFISRKE